MLTMSEMYEKAFMSQPPCRAGGEVPSQPNGLGAHHHQVAEFPLALQDADLLDRLGLEAVLPGLVRVEVADILVVRVRELEDIEDDGELLPLAREVVVEEDGDVDGGV